MNYRVAALTAYLVWVVAMGFAPNVVLRGVPDNIGCVGGLVDALTPTVNQAGCDAGIIATFEMSTVEDVLTLFTAPEIAQIAGEEITNGPLFEVIAKLGQSHQCTGGYMMESTRRNLVQQEAFEDGYDFAAHGYAPVTSAKDCADAAIKIGRERWQATGEMAEQLESGASDEERVRRQVSPVFDLSGLEHVCYYDAMFGSFGLQETNVDVTPNMVLTCTKPYTREEAGDAADVLLGPLPALLSILPSLGMAPSQGQSDTPSLGVSPSQVQSLTLLLAHRDYFVKQVELFAHGPLPARPKLMNQYNSLWYRMTEAQTDWYNCHDPFIGPGDVSDIVEVLNGQACYAEGVRSCDLLRGLHVCSGVAIVLAIGLSLASSDRAVAAMVVVLVMFASLAPVATLVIEGERAHASFFDINYVLSLVNFKFGKYPQTPCGYSWPILIERIALVLGRYSEVLGATGLGVASDLLAGEGGDPLDAIENTVEGDLAGVGALFNVIGYDVRFAWGYYLHGVTIGVGTLLWVGIVYFSKRKDAGVLF